jgi:hypothetical protein
MPHRTLIASDAAKVECYVRVRSTRTLEFRELYALAGPREANGRTIEASVSLSPTEVGRRSSSRSLLRQLSARSAVGSLVTYELGADEKAHM